MITSYKNIIKFDRHINFYSDYIEGAFAIITSFVVKHSKTEIVIDDIKYTDNMIDNMSDITTSLNEWNNLYKKVIDLYHSKLTIYND